MGERKTKRREGKWLQQSVGSDHWLDSRRIFWDRGWLWIANRGGGEDWASITSVSTESELLASCLCWTLSLTHHNQSCWGLMESWELRTDIWLAACPMEWLLNWWQAVTGLPHLVEEASLSVSETILIAAVSDCLFFILWTKQNW